MKKILVILLSLISFQLFAYDWPISNFVQGSKLSENFGTMRGQLLSTSVVFTETEEPADVITTEDAYILAVNIDESDSTDLFESTLGNSIILYHKDNLISVYGNLDKETLVENTSEKSELKKSDVIAKTGKTAWHKDKQSLEFQIIDVNNASSINPKVLLPRIAAENDLPPYSLYIENKNGDFHEMRIQKTYQSGTYRIYQKKNLISAPYKSSLSLNGVIVDEISYDTIYHENNRNYVAGKKKYSSSDIYKDDYQLLGEVILTPGKSTININIENFTGKTAAASYQISIY